MQALGRERHFYHQFADGLQTPHRQIAYQARIQVGSSGKAKMTFFSQAAMYGCVSLAMPFVSMAVQCMLGGYLVTIDYLEPNNVYT